MSPCIREPYSGTLTCPPSSPPPTHPPRLPDTGADGLASLMLLAAVLLTVGGLAFVFAYLLGEEAVTTAAQVLAVAKTQVGYVEGPKDNQNRYAAEVGHANFQPWCATSVVWVFKRAGGLALLPSTSAYTPTMYQGFKNAGQAVTGSMRTALKPGDVVFFEWPGKGRIAHVGIFSHYDAKGAWCYEGNTNAAGSRTGGEFLLKHRKHGLITHAGRPKYGAAAPVAAPVTTKEDDMGLTAPDKKFLRDLFVLVLRGEDHTGKKTGHPNLEDLTAKVAALQADVDALQADHAKHTDGA